MEKKEKEALISVLDRLDIIINVSRRNAMFTHEFMIDAMSDTLTGVLDALKTSTEAIDVSELLTSVAEYYKPLEKRDAIEAGDFDDRQEVKWFLARRDIIKNKLEEQ